MKNHSKGREILGFFPDAGGLHETPWLKKRLGGRLGKLAGKLAEKTARKCGVSKKVARNHSGGSLINQIDEKILFTPLVDMADDFFFAGFDFCLDLQKAQRDFANGNAEALRPFMQKR